MDDKQIIFLLGGPTKVSDLLGYSKKKDHSESGTGQLEAFQLKLN